MGRGLAQLALLTTLVLATVGQEWNWNSMANIILDSPQGFGTAQVDGNSWRLAETAEETGDNVGIIWTGGTGINLAPETREAIAFEIPAALQGYLESLVFLVRPHSDSGFVPDSSKEQYWLEDDVESSVLAIEFRTGSPIHVQDLNTATNFLVSWYRGNDLTKGGTPIQQFKLDEFYLVWTPDEEGSRLGAVNVYQSKDDSEVVLTVGPWNWDSMVATAGDPLSVDIGIGIKFRGSAEDPENRHTMTPMLMKADGGPFPTIALAVVGSGLVIAVGAGLYLRSSEAARAAAAPPPAKKIAPISAFDDTPSEKAKLTPTATATRTRSRSRKNSTKRKGSTGGGGRKGSVKRKGSVASTKNEKRLSKGASGLPDPTGAPPAPSGTMCKGDAIEDLLKEFSIGELNLYVPILLDRGEVQDAYALAVKVEEKASNFDGAEGMDDYYAAADNVVKCLEKLGDRDALKETKNQLRQTQAMSAGIMSFESMSVKSFSSLPTVETRVSIILAQPAGEAVDNNDGPQRRPSRKDSSGKHRDRAPSANRPGRTRTIMFKNWDPDEIRSKINA